jgi:hypothetical protein
MIRVLHLKVSAPNQDACSDLASASIQAIPFGTSVEVIDLSQGQIDYDDLLDKIFSSDSVQVW